MTEPKLPIRWREKSYQVDQSEEASLDNRESLLQLKSAMDMLIALFPGKDEWGRWSVLVFVDGRYHKSLGAAQSIAEATDLAEKIASWIPGAVVVGNETRTGRTELAPMKASDLATVEIEPRLWHVANLIPAGDITSLYGDGGTGKSLLSLQLGVATATGRPWIGRPVTKGSCFFLSAEDPLNELHRRLAAIASAEGLRMSDFADLELVSLAGQDAMLAVVEDDGRTLSPSPLFDMLKRRVVETKPALIVLDTLADLFPGDENSKVHTRQFVTLLRRIALASGAAIVVLAHPSVAGMASGFGTSGNTAWSNSVRSRLYLERIYHADPRRQGGLVEPDADVRVLSNKKLNYGPSGASVRVRWNAGVYSVDERLPASSVDVAAMTVESSDRAEAKFVELLMAYQLEGRNVTHTPTGSYAPTLFAKDERAEKIGKSAFVAAMNRLLTEKRILIEEHGPPSKRRSRLAIVPSDALPT